MRKYLFLLLLGGLMATGCANAQETKKVFPLSDFSGAISPGQVMSVSSGNDAAKINWESYGAISFYVRSAIPGTSGGALAFDIKDAGGKMFRFIVKNISWDRKQVVCPFVEFFKIPEAQAADGVVNDTLDFPILSFQFEPIGAAQEIFIVDGVSLEPLN